MCTAVREHRYTFTNVRDSIHSAIHAARPDVIAAVHCHSVPSKAFSSLGIKLDPINQDACR